MYDKAFVDPGVRIKRSQVFLMFGCILVIFPHNAKKRLIIFKNVLQLFIPGCLLCSKNASFVMHVGRMRTWIQGSSYSKLIKNRSRSQSQSQPANTSVSPRSSQKNSPLPPLIFSSYLYSYFEKAKLEIIVCLKQTVFIHRWCGLQIS